jgi:transposase InsO family protein
LKAVVDEPLLYAPPSGDSEPSTVSEVLAELRGGDDPSAPANIPSTAITASAGTSPSDSLTAIIDECVERIGILGPSQASAPSPSRRGSAHQHQRRRQERLTRRRIAMIGERLVDNGSTWNTVASWLDLSPRTLRSWRDLEVATPAPLLGRPVVRSPRELRNEVLHRLDEIGPHLGVPSLREHFPTMGRAELADLVRRYRRLWRHRHREPLRVLHWDNPGRVWAIDFAQAPALVDGRLLYLFAVRDLASGMQLLWQPIASATAEAAAAGLAQLFALHGAPLVIKCDNGSPFGAPAVQDLLARHEVATLFSPPLTPRYNGSIEAGIGSLKTRTDAAAARAGHPGVWTLDDLALAQSEANFTARPRGRDGPCPELIWQARMPIEAPERLLFRSRLEAEMAEAIEAKLLEAAVAACEMTTGEVWSDRAMARLAIRRSLEVCGYLTYQRRRIPPHIPRPKAADIP